MLVRAVWDVLRLCDGADMAVDAQMRLPEGFPNLRLLLVLLRRLLLHRRVLIRLIIAAYNVEASD